jgi:peptidoglycan/LPS O-acetylase OafA/YrhL
MQPVINESASGRDIKSLTGLRGLAAIYVVLHHYVGAGSFTNWRETCLTHGYLAVDVFFVLSGFVMALNYNHLFARGFSASSYFKFIGRRIARIYPIYIITTIVAFCFIISGLDHDISASVSSPHIWALKLAVNALLIQSWGIAGSLNGPAWSLSAEWAAYAVFPLLLVPCLSKNIRLAYLATGACVATLTLLYAYQCHARHDGSLAFFDISTYRHALSVVRCVPEFTLGIIAFRFAETNFGRKLRHSAANSLLLPLFILVLLFIPESDLLFVLLLPLFIISLAGGTTHIMGRLLSSRLALLAGRLSYSIYLLHTLFGEFIDNWQQKIPAFDIISSHDSAIIIALCLTAITAFLTYTYIEVPSRLWLRHIFESKSKHASSDLGAA